MHRADTLLLYILTGIAIGVCWFYPEQWFWIAAAWWFCSAAVGGAFSAQRNNDVVGFFILMVIHAMTVGAAAFWYLHPGQWWWVIPVWFCSINGVIFLRHKLFPVPTLGNQNRAGASFHPRIVNFMIKAVSLVLYLFVFGVGVMGTRWGLDWLVPGLSHWVKFALTIPICLLIMFMWPLPLPYYMSREYVLYGKKASEPR